MGQRLKFVFILGALFYMLPLLKIDLRANEKISSEKGYFQGRVSRINSLNSLIRFRLEFSNMKFLTKGDKLKFWLGYNKKIKCHGIIAGKSTEYMLVRLNTLSKCVERLQLTVGTVVSFHSLDLKSNIGKSKEVLNILALKRSALKARRDRYKGSLNGHIMKVNIVNQRYHILKQKLENEWEKELSRLEEDRVLYLRKFKKAEIALANIDHKIKKYKVEDKNIKKDRWMLDNNIYLRKN